MRTAVQLGLVIALGLSSWVCSSPPPPHPEKELPILEGRDIDPVRVPVLRMDNQDTSVAVSLLVVAYQGAVEAEKGFWRSREAAKERAQRLAFRARLFDSDFGQLHKEFNESSKFTSNQGDLGVVQRDSLHPSVEEVAFALGVEQVSDPIEIPQGFAIVYRHEPTEFQAGELLITYTGAEKYSPRVARSRAEAQALAEKIYSALEEGASFERLAQQYSDHPSAERGGFVALFRRGANPVQFEDLVLALPVGGLSRVEETRTGFHIVRRYPVERVQIRRILLAAQPRSATEDPDHPLRSQTEQRDLLENLRQRATKSDGDFAALAREFSDGPEDNRGGLLDPFPRGQHEWELERTAFGLRPGEVSALLSLQEGMCLIKRIR